MDIDSEVLKNRTRQFALNIIKLVEDFPKTKVGDIIGRQLIRSATSIGANYRSACRAQSHAHFISKISIVEEEADEALYWLELALATGLVEAKRLSDLINEANELTAILTSSRYTAKKRKQ